MHQGRGCRDPRWSSSLSSPARGERPSSAGQGDPGLVMCLHPQSQGWVAQCTQKHRAPVRAAEPLATISSQPSSFPPAEKLIHPERCSDLPQGHTARAWPGPEPVLALIHFLRVCVWVQAPGPPRKEQHLLRDSRSGPQTSSSQPPDIVGVGMSLIIFSEPSSTQSVIT